MHPTAHLTALPDSAWDLVLQVLYGSYPPRQLRSSPRSISSLAISCRSLRDTVRRVRTHAAYCLLVDPEGARLCAEHLNNHTACTSVRMHLATKPSTPLPDFPEVAPFQQHISHAASHRLAHLALSCAPEDRPWDPLLLPESAVLELAEALPGLRTMAFHTRTTGISELFPGLAARCPQLRKLQVTLPSFSPEAIGSLAALSGLTSLDLQAEEEPGDEYEEELYQLHPIALLLPLGALTKLTHLSLLSIHWNEGDRILPWGDMKHLHIFPVPAPPIVAHFGSLRSLELTSCTLGMDSFPWLAAALPSLERLVCDGLDNIGGVDVLEPIAWRMPNLRVIKLKTVNCLDSDDAVYVAAGCPALQRFEGFKIVVDIRGRLPAGVSEAGEARRWVQGLSELAARRVAFSVLVAAGDASSAAWAEGLCEALEEVQPAELQEALVGCIHHLTTGGLSEDPASSLGLLVACLPCLNEATLRDFSQLPALAALESLSVVCVWNGERAAAAALGAFAQRRAEALGPDAAARAVMVRSLGQKRVEVRVQSGVVHGLDA